MLPSLLEHHPTSQLKSELILIQSLKSLLCTTEYNRKEYNRKEINQKFLIDTNQNFLFFNILLKMGKRYSSSSYYHITLLDLLSCPLVR
jgi:hypothetical protein